MKIKLPLIALAAAGVVATSAAAAVAHPVAAPSGAQGQAYWANVQWDDDHDDRARLGAMPLPDAAALKRAGMVRVVEVERDDGFIEVEGYDAKGRELDIRMDAKGTRVLSVERDNDDHRRH